MGDSLDCSGSEFFLLSREITDAGAALRFEVHGWSMYPLVRDRDVVEVVPTHLEAVSIGDIVFYRSGHRLRVHRVVGRVRNSEGDQLRTRGDNFRQEDPLVTQADLIGRVQTVFRQRGGSPRAIPQDVGIARWTGVLLARSALVQCLFRWISRLLRRLGRSRP